MWCSRGCLGPHATSVACLWHVSVAGGARRRGCAAGGVSVTFNRLLGEEVVVPLDPSIEALLAEMAEQGAKPFEELSVPEARVAARAFAELQGPPEDVASVEHHFIPGPTADLPVRIYTPEGDGPFGGLV